MSEVLPTVIDLSTPWRIAFFEKMEQVSQSTERAKSRQIRQSDTFDAP